MAVRRYIVTETRQVSVEANSAANAVRIAAAAFEHGQKSDYTIDGHNAPEDTWGVPTSKIRATNISATEV